MRSSPKPINLSNFDRCEKKQCQLNRAWIWFMSLIYQRSIADIFQLTDF
jgi:hypothetical protein